MGSSQREVDRFPESNVITCVHIALCISRQLLENPEAMHSDSAAGIASGILARLRKAWSDHAVFLEAISDLQPVSLRKEPDAQSAGQMTNQVQLILAVL